jgi:hypothetical protein
MKKRIGIIIFFSFLISYSGLCQETKLDKKRIIDLSVELSNFGGEYYNRYVPESIFKYKNNIYGIVGTYQYTKNLGFGAGLRYFPENEFEIVTGIKDIGFKVTFFVPTIVLKYTLLDAKYFCINMGYNIGIYIEILDVYESGLKFDTEYQYIPGLNMNTGLFIKLENDLLAGINWEYIYFDIPQYRYLPEILFHGYAVNLTLIKKGVF